MGTGLNKKCKGAEFMPLEFLVGAQNQHGGIRPVDLATKRLGFKQGFTALLAAWPLDHHPNPQSYA